MISQLNMAADMSYGTISQMDGSIQLHGSHYFHILLMMHLGSSCQRMPEMIDGIK